VTGATGNVDEAIAAIRRDARDELFCERSEQWPDQNALGDFGKRRSDQQRCL